MKMQRRLNGVYKKNADWPETVNNIDVVKSIETTKNLQNQNGTEIQLLQDKITQLEKKLTAKLELVENMKDIKQNRDQG